MREVYTEALSPHWVCQDLYPRLPRRDRDVPNGSFDGTQALGNLPERCGDRRQGANEPAEEQNRYEPHEHRKDHFEETTVTKIHNNPH
jgi:hypothetical protein